MHDLKTVLTSLRVPVVAAPMFLLSQPETVIACCQAGVIGSMPALNLRTSEALDEALTAISAGIPAGAPYAINLIVHPSNPRLKADIAIVAKHRVPIVITSLGAVAEVVDAVHAYGGLVWHDVTTRRHAEKAVAAGVDGIVAVAAGAGGHGGQLSPFALVSEIRQFFDGTLLLGGAINHGRDLLAAQVMGADLAYMGTRFIATEESLADQR
ncbi:MAG: NAD(P)H-dependent flavin oxidoreductase, partial [Litorivicinus sp.]